MSDEIEVNPLGGMEGVSPVAAPNAAAPKMRGRGIDLSSLTPEELKQHKSAIDTKSRAKRADKQKAESYVYGSKTEPSKAEVKEILGARGLKNSHVIDLCFDIGLVAAEQNGLPANRFFFKNGIRKMLESYKHKAPQSLDLISEEDVESELLNRAELFALYDFGFWRQTEVTFDQWLADRLKFKMSAFELSKILGKEDFGSKHESWTDFAPRWNPIGLKPGYTQKQALTWLDAQSETKKYLLIASRNSMKSTWARIFCLTLLLTYWDARILYITETNRLSRKAMKEIRGWLEMDISNPTLFQQYFLEATIVPGEGQASMYDHPLARLNLPQHTIEQSSAESANTGSRFDLAIVDDFISRDNGTSNEDQRAEALSKFGALMRLREPAGYALNVQTPWVPDDLGDAMIQQNNNDEEHPLAVRIDPVMEIRPEARGKGLFESKEEDVILNFLPKLNWRFVRDEMRSPEGTTFFRTQYLCQWVRDDDQIKVNFDHEALWGRVRPHSFFGTPLIHNTFISLDRSWSTSRYADFSCANVCRIQTVESKNAMIVLDTYMDRVRESELILGLVKLIEKWRPTLLIGQQDKGYQDFGDSFRKALMLRGLPVPYLRFVPVNNAPKAKVRRVKVLENPIHDGRIYFSSGNAKLEEGLNQMEKFDGVTPSNSHRKDDWPDSVALAWENLGPRHQEEIPVEDLENRRMEEEEEGARERRRNFYNSMFSGDPPQRARQLEEQPQQPRDPRLALFGSRGKWRM